MNVVFVAIDALRADHLGVYGYERPTSPFIDALAAGGVVFDNHFTPAAPTQPAFTTIFSGTHPLTHGVVCHDGNQPLNPRVEWLPSVLRQQHCTTVAVDTLCDHRPYFARGFEYYVNPRIKGEFPSCQPFNVRAIEWLEHCRREPFFLFIHYWNTHTPYLPAPKVARLFYDGDPTTTNMGSLDDFYQCPTVDRWPEDWFGRLRATWPNCAGGRIEDRRFIEAQYDAEVRSADDGVKTLCAVLESKGLLDDTLLVVFADHGEHLGEHGIWFDHHGLYDPNVRTPLILHWPKDLKGGRRVSVMTQHQDLFATVLDAIGAQVPEVVEGRSLLPLAKGFAAPPDWDQTLMTCECTWQKKWAMRTADNKLIVSREPDWHGHPAVELYDLKSDPGEQVSLAESHAGLARQLKAQFEAKLQTMLDQRSLSDDPIAANDVTLGRAMWHRLGKPYPPPREGVWARS